MTTRNTGRTRLGTLMGAIVGPRVPELERRAHPWRYAAPSLCLMLGRLLLLISIFLPYWHMELEAPQYPQGLFLTAYVNHLAGDVKEIDGLNHYIGMRPLDEAARFEKIIAIWAVISMFLLIELAALVHSRWAVLLAIPAITFPVAFLVDLRFWLVTFGRNLDPDAPLSSSVKPFTPTLLGEGGIGQFMTWAELGLGWWLAICGAAITVVGFFFHRRAYRPLLLRERLEHGGDAVDWTSP